MANFLYLWCYKFILRALKVRFNSSVLKASIIRRNCLIFSFSWLNLQVHWLNFFDKFRLAKYFIIILFRRRF